MTSNEAFALALNTQTAAPPAAKLAIICAVTSAGKALTPSSATPWSAPNTITRAGSIVGERVFLTVDSWTATDSSSPSEPGGLVLLSIACCALAPKLRGADDYVESFEFIIKHCEFTS